MMLVVEVVDAHNLMPKDGEGSASPFVEVDFANQRSRTRTVQKNLNPFWNQKLVFDLDESNSHIHQIIEVCVYNERRPLPGRNFLGRVRIPGSSIAREGEEAYQRFQLEKKWFSSFVKGEIGVKVYTSHSSALKSTPRPSSPYAPPQTQLHTSSPTPNPLTKSISEHTHLIDAVSVDIAPPTPANSSIPSTPKVITTYPKEEISEPAETDQSFFPAEGQKEEIKETVKVETKATQAQKNNYKHQALKQPDLSADKQPQGVSVAMNRGDSPRLHPGKPHEDFSLKDTSPLLGEQWPKGGGAFSGRGWMRGERLTSTFDLVEQMFYLFVRVVKAKDLPPNPLTGSCDPYVEVRLGNNRGRTQHFDKKLNPEWNQVFAFTKDHIQSSMLEVLVRDQEMVGNDDCVGKVMFDLNEVPTRVPPDSPLAPQWYRLEDLRGHSKAREEIMVAVWMGTQADEAFPEAWHSDSASVYGEGVLNIRSKVYVSPKLWYVRINVVEAQDIVPNDRTRAPQLFAKVQVGSQVLRTNICPTQTLNPLWNEDLIFVAAEPFEEQMLVTIEDRVYPTKDQVLGKLALPLNDLEKRLDHRAVQSRWFNLERHHGIGAQLEGDTRRELKFSSRVHLRVCLEGGYHVLDESTMYTSDQRPTARQLWEQPVGILEVGILGAQDLLPMKMKDGRGITDAYCVAKYGQKWVRTRTAINTFNPKWNEQYTWQVYDPCTIITVGVFDNGHLGSRSNSASAARDSRIGKVRIRLSTLESRKIYTHSFPLLVLHPPGVKKMGELQLAIRFTSLSLSHMIYIYGHPLLPKMHYLHPLTVNQVDNLRYQAMNIVAVRLSRAEPPLRKEVVEYMLDVDSHLWSMRRSKANFFRIISLLSGMMSVSRLFEDVCYWKSPVTSVLVHILFLILVWYPELILPTIFLYMFLIGMWNYRHRPRQPPHMDIKLSRGEAVHPDELDEECDTFPTSRPQDVVRMRYDRLRSVAGRIQTIVGDIATQGERFQSLLSWRDPRATSLFISFCFCAAVVLYVTPFKAVSLIAGLYMLRHPRFRSRLPSVPSSFFKRLPTRSDSLL